MSGGIKKRQPFVMLENHVEKDLGSPLKGMKATILMPNGTNLRTTIE